VKDNSDSGQFLAIQHASAYAFDHPEITARIAAKYSRRMDLLVETLRAAGFRARKPRGSFFLYVAAPRRAESAGSAVDFPNAEAFSQWMIAENLISTVPWDEAGAYVRFSVTFAARDPEDEKRVVAEIGRRLGRSKFHW
jgi:LL-diaminopimelate aminotransferase